MKRVISLLQSRRLWGLAGTGVVLYFLLFVVFARVDMSWIMPDTNALARSVIAVWPRMPFFAVEKEPPQPDGAQVIYYTVPTRQLSRAELNGMEGTNRVVNPAGPR